MRQAALGFLLCALPLAPSWADDCKPLQMVASIPLSPQDDRRVELVPVKFNGIKKNLLLDTGGYLSQISPQVVNALRLSTGGSGVRLIDITASRRPPPPASPISKWAICGRTTSRFRSCRTKTWARPALTA